MPAMHYRLRWPDHSESECYSPSLVIRDYFVPGADYALPEFMQRIREATDIASERVRSKYGFRCLRAEAQLQVIESRARHFAGQPQARILVLSFHDTG